MWASEFLHSEIPKKTAREIHDGLMEQFAVASILASDEIIAPRQTTNVRGFTGRAFPGRRGETPAPGAPKPFWASKTAEEAYTRLTAHIRLAYSRWTERFEAQNRADGGKVSPRPDGRVIVSGPCMV